LDCRDTAPTNPRGIPYAPFVDKVEDYVATRADVEPTLRGFQEMIAKYQFMEQNLQRRVAGLKDKMPDIQKTLDTVQFLQLRKVRSLRMALVRGRKGEEERGNGTEVDVIFVDEQTDEELIGSPPILQDETDPIETTFELNETLHAKAQIPPTDEVYIWLGVRFNLARDILDAWGFTEMLTKVRHKTGKRHALVPYRGGRAAP